jgi:hypothetical protein
VPRDQRMYPAHGSLSMRYVGAQWRSRPSGISELHAPLTGHETESPSHPSDTPAVDDGVKVCHGACCLSYLLDGIDRRNGGSVVSDALGEAKQRGDAGCVLLQSVSLGGLQPGRH